MKVRAGFVSNSSSTSFLILTKEELTEDAFLGLMGVDPKSPLARLFRELYDQLIYSSTMMDFRDPGTAPESLPEGERVPKSVMDRLHQARQDGMVVYYGYLGSDGNRVEQFFCTETFEAENEKIYFNCLECVW